MPGMPYFVVQIERAVGLPWWYLLLVAVLALLVIVFVVCLFRINRRIRGVEGELYRIEALGLPESSKAANAVPATLVSMQDARASEVSAAVHPEPVAEAEPAPDPHAATAPASAQNTEPIPVVGAAPAPVAHPVADEVVSAASAGEASQPAASVAEPFAWHDVPVAAPVAEAEPEASAAAEPEPHSGAESAAASAESDSPVPAQEPAAEPEPQPEAASATEPEPEPEPNPEPVAEPEPKPEPAVDPRAEAQARVRAALEDLMRTSRETANSAAAETQGGAEFDSAFEEFERLRRGL